MHLRSLCAWQPGRAQPSASRAPSESQPLEVAAETGRNIPVHLGTCKFPGSMTPFQENRHRTCTRERWPREEVSRKGGKLICILIHAQLLKARRKGHESRVRGGVLNAGKMEEWVGPWLPRSNSLHWPDLRPWMCLLPTLTIVAAYKAFGQAPATKARIFCLYGRHFAMTDIASRSAKPVQAISGGPNDPRTRNLRTQAHVAPFQAVTEASGRPALMARVKTGTLGRLLKALLTSSLIPARSSSWQRASSI